MSSTSEQTTQLDLNFEPIRGYPELRWAGKRPFRSTYYYPAQLKERYGEPEEDGWINKLYWGDNLQVMSHLVKHYRGQVKLIYIDPPYDSKADYKKKIELRGTDLQNDRTAFEEKQYTDIWTNDEYLQFMYERLVLIRELLAGDGTLYLHCDSSRNFQLRCILAEVFGNENCRNEIIWHYQQGTKPEFDFGRKHDTIYRVAKSGDCYFRQLRLPTTDPDRYTHVDGEGRKYVLGGTGMQSRYYALEARPCDDVWTWLDKWDPNRVNQVNQSGKERVGYPTQKPEKLLERIVQCSTVAGDLVLDAFMGSGTTQAVAMKLGRRFIGCDINLGAIHTTISRLTDVAKELDRPKQGELARDLPITPFTSFEVHTVNHYDVFRNEVEGRPLLMDALGITASTNRPWDGTKIDDNGQTRMVKVMPINRIATRADLSDILANPDLKRWDGRAKEHPNEPVERITLVCMGHEPDLGANLDAELRKLTTGKFDIQVVDVLRDGAKLEFKRDSEAKVVIAGSKLTIETFYPMNLLQKLSLERQAVGDWKDLVDSVMIDWNYDGAVFSPTVIDVPEGKVLTVRGIYPIPEDAGQIRVKITDVLSESWEATVWGAE